MITKYRTYIILAISILLSWQIDICSAKVSRQQLEKIENQAYNKEMELKKKQAEAVALSLELAKLNKDMIKAANKIQADEEKTTKMEKQLDFLAQKLKINEEIFYKEHKNLVNILTAIQSLALYPSETLVIQPLSPVEIIQSAILMREYVPYLKNATDKLKNDIQKINDQKKQISTSLEKIEKQKQILLKQQEKIKKMSEQKTAVRKKLEGESLDLKQQADKLASEASNLKELVEKLEKDEELNRRRKAEIKKAAKRREQEALKKLEEEQNRRIKEGKTKGFSDENGNFYNDTNYLEQIKPQEKAISSDFTLAKGRLPYPVKGEIITSYGQELSKGVTSKGIVIKTRNMAQVIAPYDGSVVFSGPFKGYGNLIIIEHGKGYVSLLAGLSSTDTQIGQNLLAGEPVGIMPDNNSAKLYMEIRKDQNPINPEPWLEK